MNKNNKKSNVEVDSQLFDVLQQGFLAPDSHPSVSVDYQRLGITEQENSSLFFSIVNQSSNVVVITDIDKNIIYVNKKFEQSSGYSLDEVIGKNPRVLKSKQTPTETYRDMHVTLQSGKQWRGIFINVHRNGNEYIEEAVITPIVNDQGAVICFLAEKKDITAQKIAEERVLKLTQFDSLTGLPNRAYFIDEVERLTKFKADSENRFSILFSDIDRFRDLNDIHGHLSGDLALKLVSKRLAKVITTTDFIARVDGDEFVIIHRYSSMESTASLAQKLIRSFEEPIVIEGHKNYLGVSIGSAIWPSDGQDFKQLLSHSDMAMHKAKNSNETYVAYNNALGDQYHRESELSRRLKYANEQQQLSLVYQPKFDLNTKKVIGLEALLRWNEPEYGFVSPSEFIPIAEHYGLMTDIGLWVISNVCKQINDWQVTGVVIDGRIAINISVQQLEQPNFYQDIMYELTSHNISPSQIELEISESALIYDPSKMLRLLDRFTEAGFSISIDDFGTGHSSLTYLHKLTLDVLKIDSSFISNVATDDVSQAIVQSIKSLAHNLKLKVIAEGVETEEQLNFLESIGCDMVQGFYYSKPLGIDHIATYIKSCE